jgi:competence protein ComEC
VWLALYVSLGEWWASLVAVGGFGLGLWRRRIYALPLVVAGGVALGLWHGSVSSDALHIYQPLIGKQISLTGHIKDDPAVNAKGQLVIQLDSVTARSHSLPGSVWVSVIGKPDLKRGDEVVVAGELSAGFGSYAGALYTARIMTITHPQPGDIARVVRDWFVVGIRRAIPEPEASLGIGYLVGLKSALPDDLAQALQIAGLSHVVIASGYNLTILVRLARRLFVKLSKYLAMISASVMIMCFVAVTGLSPSMTRAGLVSGLSLAAWYYGRVFHPFVLLPLTAAVTVALQPNYIWGDVGWELSFAAFAAVMIVGPLFQRYFFGEKEPGTIRQILGETVAAHIVTIPIILLAFGMLSNIAIPANLLVVPLVPLAMLLTFIAGIAGLTFPAIASIVGLPATWLLGYMITTTQYLASLPWAQTKFTAPWWISPVYYVVLAAICVYVWRVTKFSLRTSSVVE